MQEREFYSKGFHAGIYEVSSQERLWFPHADLVRLDKPRMAGDKNRFARMFYSHKIAQILFPNNFINVVAARVDRDKDSDKYRTTSRTNMLYSQKADIPIEHSTFSAHMELPYRAFQKVFSCRCSDCTSHRAFHLSNALAEKAEEVSIPMGKIGILPAYSGDPSDYCLTGQGNIVFFEIDVFNDKALGEYLSSLENPNSREKEALVLINRYNELLSE